MSSSRGIGLDACLRPSVDSLDRRGLAAKQLSGGGDISKSLDVAEAIVASDVTVAVHTLCGSGCANNLFLPADRHIILKDAIVAFHGGASLSLADRVEQDREKILAANPGIDLYRVSREWRERMERDVTRHDEMRRASGVDRAFFAWFDRMAGQPTSAQSPDCAANPEAEAIAFFPRSSSESAVFRSSTTGDFVILSLFRRRSI